MKLLTLVTALSWSTICESAILQARGSTSNSGAHGLLPRQESKLIARNAAYYDSVTRDLWSSQSYGSVVNYNQTIQMENPQRRLSKRNSPIVGPIGDWVSSGFNPNEWNSFLLRSFVTCPYQLTNSIISLGMAVKMVVNQEGNTPLYKWWYNETRLESAAPFRLVGGRPVYRAGCSFAADSYHPQQCKNQIWIQNGARWENSTTSNANTGWSTNNATYNGHTVRTIYDCLLKRVAVEYKTAVTALGAIPVQYKIDGMKYYRFYDNNNFAWFFACPSPLQKRQGVNRGLNPVWDFNTGGLRDPLADSTPVPTDLIPDYTYYGVYTAVFWPKNNQSITIDGHVGCQYMAVSRPGLKHWTARLIDIPPETYAEPAVRTYNPDWYSWSQMSWSWDGPTVKREWNRWDRNDCPTGDTACRTNPSKPIWGT